MGEALKPVMQFPLVRNRERGTQLNAVCMGADFGHAIVLSGVTCFTRVTALQSTMRRGSRRKRWTSTYGVFLCGSRWT
jgi:hypothetical protein